LFLAHVVDKTIFTCAYEDGRLDIPEHMLFEFEPLLETY
jgi:hypothetical protein